MKGISRAFCRKDQFGCLAIFSDSLVSTPLFFSLSLREITSRNRQHYLCYCLWPQYRKAQQVGKTFSPVRQHWNPFAACAAIPTSLVMMSPQHRWVSSTEIKDRKLLPHLMTDDVTAAQVSNISWSCSPKTFTVSSPHEGGCHYSTGVTKPVQFPHHMNNNVTTAQVLENLCSFLTSWTIMSINVTTVQHRWATLAEHRWATPTKVKLRKPSQFPHSMKDD